MKFRLKFLAAAAALTIYASLSQAQFGLQIVPSSTLTATPAIHSGAFTEYNGKWIFIGGRKNGLHGFLPPSAFPSSGINDKIWVVDPATNQGWSALMDSLPVNQREPLQSSNMQFYRQDSILYMIGGYGWKDSLQDFITFPVLTSVRLPGLIQAVMNNQDVRPYFRYVVDQRLAICGGHLQKLDSLYHLVFGHRFDGRYDKSSTTGFFVQKYSNEIRKFTIQDQPSVLQIGNYTSVKDTVNFHRRDFNLIPQVYPNGSKALTAFSGVFRYDANLPYLTCIDIHSSGYTHQSSFNQNLSQYHSAVAALYDTVSKDQHNIFFGGMSIYFIDSVSGNNVYDSLVPFVNTVSSVVRSAANNYTEFNMGIRMPALAGTNAYFMPADGLTVLHGEVIVINNLPDSTLLGYIIGGIESPEVNISLTDPSLSYARIQPLEVYYRTTPVSSSSEVKNEILNFRSWQRGQDIVIEFELTRPRQVSISAFTSGGKLVKRLSTGNKSAGKHQVVLPVGDLSKGLYFTGLETGGTIKFSKLVLK